MNKKEFLEWVNKRVRILDGATGTLMQSKGMPSGVCPEQWVIENPDILAAIQREYVKSGSEMIYTFTFGGNAIKLDEFGLGDRTEEINEKIAKLARKAAGNNVLIAGDLAPTGVFIRPLGVCGFEEIVDCYKRQVKGLLSGGVDLFVIETMMDIQEARAALIAVKESCDLPAMVSMTYEKGNRTLTGTDPVSALITLQGLGADVVGCNCSTGPEEMIEIIKIMKPYAKVPIIAKPNAGLPKIKNGRTFFDMPADVFAGHIISFIPNGVNLVGGCCGTNPEYIKEVYKAVGGKTAIPPVDDRSSFVTSSRQAVEIGKNLPITVIGERINPTGKKRLKEELKNGSYSLVMEYAIQQVSKGADVLDVNAGMPGIDEKQTMLEILETLTPLADAPLCLDSSSTVVLKEALRIYPGRALINSISGESKKLEALLPLAGKYGAMFVLLPLDDGGVPKTAEERFVIIEKILERAKDFGITRDDVLVDGLVMTISSDQGAAQETLKVVEWCTRNGLKSVLGLSNVSFGLPGRVHINSGFLSMAAARGLTAAICNPNDELLMSAKYAADALMGRDVNCLNYISFAAKTEQVTAKSLADQSPEEKVYSAVIDGNKDAIKNLVNDALSYKKPAELVDNYLIPAIAKVGDLYEQKKYFLPQLIQSAETMKIAFAIIEPLLAEEAGNTTRKASVVLATVKGDIHDIGKNIVGLMLKNYGFDVIDLGKDVPSEEIIKKARDKNADIIGLSALMTTTMPEMKIVMDLVRKERLGCKVMIGGAVVDQHYADEIGAHGYSHDAYEAVKLAQSLIDQNS